MIDTVKIIIDTIDIPLYYNQFLLNLDTHSIKKNHKNEITITGYVKNFQVTLDNWGVRVEGSLTRYIFGDNFKSATQQQLMNGVMQLSQETQLNLMNGKISRLDVAENILTKFPVPEYFDGLAEIRYFKRYQFPTTLKYGGLSRYITIYDKIAESKKKKVEVDDMLKGKNFLRYEVSYPNHKALCKLLKIHKCSFSDIFLNYSKIIDEWLRLFNKIEKKTDALSFDFENLKTSKDIFKQLQIQGVIRLNGLSEVLKMIDVGKQRGYFKSHPNVATNIRSSLKNLMKTPNLVKDSPLNQELSKKISLIHFHAYLKPYDEYVHI